METKWKCEYCNIVFGDDELDIDWTHNEVSLCPICHQGEYLVEVMPEISEYEKGKEN